MIGKKNRKKAKKIGKKVTERAQSRAGRAITLFLLTVVLVFFTYAYIEAHMLHVEVVDVSFKELPSAFDGMKIVFVSDIHASGINPPQNAIDALKPVLDMKPDALIIGGDTAYIASGWSELLGPIAANWASENRAYLAEFFAKLSELDLPPFCGVVKGNHDISTGQYFDELAKAAGFFVLDNAVISIWRGEQGIKIAGLGDLKEGRPDIIAVASAVRRDDFVILVSHEPDIIPGALGATSSDDGAWINLILSGHTHGGQVTLFGKKASIPNSVAGMGFYGWTKQGGALSLNSNGMGAVVAPLRFFAPPQIHVLTLKKA